MPLDTDGVMIILSSPSGAGKTTLLNLISKLDNFEISIHTPLENLDQMKSQTKTITLSVKMNLIG